MEGKHARMGACIYARGTPACLRARTWNWACVLLAEAAVLRWINPRPSILAARYIGRGYVVVAAHWPASFLGLALTLSPQMDTEALNPIPSDADSGGKGLLQARCGGRQGKPSSRVHMVLLSWINS